MKRSNCFSIQPLGGKSLGPWMSQYNEKYPCCWWWNVTKYILSNLRYLYFPGILSFHVLYTSSPPHKKIPFTKCSVAGLTAVPTIINRQSCLLSLWNIKTQIFLFPYMAAHFHWMKDMLNVLCIILCIFLWSLWDLLSLGNLGKRIFRINCSGFWVRFRFTAGGYSD